jgi:hypothetical protein
MSVMSYCVQFINSSLTYLCLLHEYHVVYSVRYYPGFHVTAVGLGTYYPWIRGHYFTSQKYIGLHIKWLLILLDFSKTWIFPPQIFGKSPNINFHESSRFVRTDVTKLTVVFRNFVGAPNIGVNINVLECDKREQPPLLIQHFIRVEVTELRKLTETPCPRVVVPNIISLVYPLAAYFHILYPSH